MHPRQSDGRFFQSAGALHKSKSAHALPRSAQQTTLSLTLFDTTTEEDINFAEILVEEGHAEVDPNAKVYNSVQVESNASVDAYVPEFDDERALLRHPKTEHDLLSEAEMKAAAEKRARRPPPPPSKPRAATAPNAVRNEELMRKKQAESRSFFTQPHMQAGQVNQGKTLIRKYSPRN